MGKNFILKTLYVYLNLYEKGITSFSYFNILSYHIIKCISTKGKKIQVEYIFIQYLKEKNIYIYLAVKEREPNYGISFSQRLEMYINMYLHNIFNNNAPLYYLLN